MSITRPRRLWWLCTGKGLRQSQTSHRIMGSASQVSPSLPGSNTCSTSPFEQMTREGHHQANLRPSRDRNITTPNQPSPGHDDIGESAPMLSPFAILKATPTPVCKGVRTSGAHYHLTLSNGPERAGKPTPTPACEGVRTSAAYYHHTPGQGAPSRRLRGGRAGAP